MRAALVVACFFAVTAPAGASLAGGWCGTETASDDTTHAYLPGQVVKVVYARPSDQPNRFGVYADLIQETVQGVVERFRRETNGARLLAVDVGTSCGPQFVDIQSIVLPRPTDVYLPPGSGRPSPSAIFPDLRSTLGIGSFQGNSQSNRDYLVFVDSVAPDGAATGVAEAAGDDRPGSVNISNAGNRIAWVAGTGATEFLGLRSSPVGTSGVVEVGALHELTHALGAVNGSAPHSNGSGHATDDPFDVMYAPPPGSRVAQTTEQVVNGPYDFGRDDYFNPSPPAGSYLATHWNVFDSVFLCAPAACDVPGSPPVARLRMRLGSGSTVQADASGTTSTAPIASVRFDLDYDGTFETGTGTSLVARLRTAARAVAVRVVDRNGLVDIARALTIPGQGSEAGAGSGSGRASVRFLRRSIAINVKTGVGRVRVRCNNLATDRCRVSLSLRAKRSGARKGNLRTGKAKATIPGGKTRSVRVKLLRRGVTLLKRSRARKLRATAVGSSRNKLGRATQVRQQLTLRAKRR